MELGELKPLLKALALPPAGLLLLAAIGVLLGLRRRVAGALVTTFALAWLWLLACNGIAVLLAQSLLPGVAPASDKELQAVQAIVVLGGGVQDDSPEYGAPQPTASVLPRVRYAAVLARRTGKPVAISAGLGWGAGSERRRTTEAEVYARVLQVEYGVTPRWIEKDSRDTRENARMTATLLRPEGVRRIALVTDATHMTRSVRNFQEAGFEVVPAPTNFITMSGSLVFDWLPSPSGLRNSTYILHEWLGLRLT